MAICTAIYLLSRNEGFPTLRRNSIIPSPHSYQLRSGQSTDNLLGPVDTQDSMGLMDRMPSRLRRPRTGGSISSTYSRSSAFIPEDEAEASTSRRPSTANSSLRAKRSISNFLQGGGPDDAAVASLRVSRRKRVSLIPESGVEPDDPIDGFQPRNYFLTKEGMKHHPYPGEAPYMQSYDKMLLENDRYTNELLRRVNTNGSPTFHDYGSNPPNNVLDLGCGQGLWAAEAAAEWRQYGTRVTGFDLVDLASDTWESEDGPLDNVTWRQGNFLKYPLPFAENTFQLVRMANLSLAIPQDCWAFVISEARRVLAPGGRLELIDDQMMFPYAQTSTPILPPPPPSPHRSLSSMSSMSTFQAASPSVSISSDSTFQPHRRGRARASSIPAEYSVVSHSELMSDSKTPTIHSYHQDVQSGHKRASSDLAPSSYTLSPYTKPANRTRPRASSIPSEYSRASYAESAADSETSTIHGGYQDFAFEHKAEFSDSDTAEGGRSSLDTPSLVDDDASVRSSSSSSTSPGWRERAENAKGLEVIFENMLSKRYNIDTSPIDVIDVTLTHIFGPDNTSQLKNMNLALAPPTLPPQFLAPSRGATSPKPIEPVHHRNAVQSLYLESTSSGDVVTPTSPNANTEAISSKAVELLGLSTGDQIDRGAKSPSRLNMMWKGKKSPKSPGEQKSRPSSSETIASVAPDADGGKSSRRLSAESNHRDSWDSMSTMSSMSSGSSSGSSMLSLITPKPKPTGQGFSINAKAANRLGLTITPTDDKQSTGLVLWPTMFIPMDAAEVEMHACKHMHVLLGCKAALMEYVETIRDEHNRPCMSREEFDDLIWDYECFRRKRFRWSEEIPALDSPVPKNARTQSPITARPSSGSAVEKPLPVPGGERRPRSASAALGNAVSPTPSSQREGLTFVRTIRVYEAFKVDKVEPLRSKSVDA